MDKKDIISELESQGVRIKNNLCQYANAGKEVSESFEDAISSFNKRAQHCKEHLIELWGDLLKHLSVVPLSFYEASDSTQRMFINAVRMLNRYGRRFSLLKRGIAVISKILRMDSKNFSESYMAKLVEYLICFEWVFHVMRQNLFRAFLVEKLTDRKVTASGAMGDVDLPMEARVQVVDEMSEDDFEQAGRLHPTYTRKFRQYDLQHGVGGYDFEDRVYRLMNEPQRINRRDERQPNRTLSRNI